jgi:hypothetical protein
MGRMSKAKGKRGEREAAAELGAILNVDARRGVQYQGGPDSPDVVLPGVPIHVEAKRTERLSLWSALEQAKADAPAGSVPIVWHRPNNRASVVIVETSRLVELVQAVVEARGGPVAACGPAGAGGPAGAARPATGPSPPAKGGQTPRAAVR